MSNRGHHRPPPRRTVARETVDEFIAAAVRLAGCTCSPDASVRHTRYGPAVTILHDDGCPALAAPSVAGIVPRRPHR